MASAQIGTLLYRPDDGSGRAYKHKLKVGCTVYAVRYLLRSDWLVSSAISVQLSINFMQVLVKFRISFKVNS